MERGKGLIGDTYCAVLGFELKAGKYVGESLEGSSLYIQLLRHVLDVFNSLNIIFLLDRYIWSHGLCIASVMN
jgi:hypothetical protein